MIEQEDGPHLLHGIAGEKGNNKDVGGFNSQALVIQCAVKRRFE
jgi:hypothetical protein